MRAFQTLLAGKIGQAGRRAGSDGRAPAAAGLGSATGSVAGPDLVGVAEPVAVGVDQLRGRCCAACSSDVQEPVQVGVLAVVADAVAVGVGDAWVGRRALLPEVAQLVAVEVLDLVTDAVAVAVDEGRAGPRLVALVPVGQPVAVGVEVGCRRRSDQDRPAPGRRRPASTARGDGDGGAEASAWAKRAAAGGRRESPGGHGRTGPRSGVATHRWPRLNVPGTAGSILGEAARWAARRDGRMEQERPRRSRGIRGPGCVRLACGRQQSTAATPSPTGSCVTQSCPGRRAAGAARSLARPAVLRDPERFDAWLHRLVVHACYSEAARLPTLARARDGPARPRTTA